ncbi:hypothetical protein F0342_17900 [Bacillus sp. CH30_1T]|nr:hypothetical protein F0342_17900 [Bacillus sp. CH30_1T]
MERKVLDSCGNSWTGETPEAQLRRLTASPAESEHLERKSTSTLSVQKHQSSPNQGAYTNVSPD